MAGGANHSRLTGIIYPNGYTVAYNYASGLDDTLSRLTSLSDNTGTLESYKYLGLGTVVERDHPQPGVNLTYLQQTGDPNANTDAGDKYTGLDRFGRVIDQYWINAASGTATNRFQYGYDRDGNRLFKANLVDAAFSELYHANGSGNGYDPLNQLTAFARGILSDTNSDGIPDTVASPSHSQSWATDAVGNFTSVTTDGTPVNRTHNRQNELTAVGGVNLGYDANGNTTTDDQGHTLAFDAWNRLVSVKSGTTTLASYQYDALDRRIVESGGGTATDVYFSDQGQALEERVGGQAKAHYVWSPVYVNALVLRDRDADGNPANGLEERLYAQQDANWNVTALVNTSAAVVERYAYLPFGQVTVLTAGWSVQSGSAYGFVYGFQGLRLEAAAGIWYARWRDLSPTLMRFLQVDPIRFGAGDVDFYRQEGDNPANTTDPLGLEAKPNVQFWKQVDEWLGAKEEIKHVEFRFRVPDGSNPKDFGLVLFRKGTVKEVEYAPFFGGYGGSAVVPTPFGAPRRLKETGKYGTVQHLGRPVEGNFPDWAIDAIYADPLYLSKPSSRWNYTKIDDRTYATHDYPQTPKGHRRDYAFKMCIYQLKDVPQDGTKITNVKDFMSKALKCIDWEAKVTIAPDGRVTRP